MPPLQTALPVLPIGSKNSKKLPARHAFERERTYTRYRILVIGLMCVPGTHFFYFCTGLSGGIKRIFLFRFWVLPEHDYESDYCYHHNRTHRQKQIDCRGLVYLFQFHRILLGLPGSYGNVGCSIRILLQG